MGENVLIAGMPVWAFVLLMLGLIISIIWYFKFKPQEEQ